MRAQVLAAIAAVLVFGVPAAATARPHLPARPGAASLLAAAPIAPNGLLIHDAGRLRTLELDELAPLRLRLSIPF
ncbi:hypothetical protein [Methylobacterium sp. yr668]|uniref:hypothetical protein n=1 Tax=Methylobacterium sp. yr668 TaxID=1761801 RepID=UPI0008E2FD16|nr:hypothetical protein [Methylobacterium sp. yr668]SFT11927.1 hypothetical protein SAMN04487845_11750 [Methylobacterium sp. yr668]